MTTSILRGKGYVNQLQACSVMGLSGRGDLVSEMIVLTSMLTLNPCFAICEAGIFYVYSAIGVVDRHMALSKMDTLDRLC